MDVKGISKTNEYSERFEGYFDVWKDGLKLTINI